MVDYRSRALKLRVYPLAANSPCVFLTGVPSGVKCPPGIIIIANEAVSETQTASIALAMDLLPRSRCRA